MDDQPRSIWDIVMGDDDCDPSSTPPSLTEAELAEAIARFRCVDCGFDTRSGREYYMLNHDLWTALGFAPGDGMLCLGCVEDRLGRRLTTPDFLDCPLNFAADVPRSARLTDRLGLWFTLDPEIRELVTLHRAGALTA